MIQRLLEFMRIKNLTSSQLADVIGVQRSGISHFVSGRNKPSLEFILKILHHFPEVNPDWLLLGKEPVFRGETYAVSHPIAENHPHADIVETDTPVSSNFQPTFLDELFNEIPLPQVNEELQTKTVVRPDTESHPQTQVATSKETLTRPDTESHPPKATKASESNEDKEIKNKIAPVETPGDAKAERIVIFYTDRTFREYYPS